MIASAVVFTIPHFLSWGSLHQFYILNCFLVGILLGLYLLRSGSIWGPSMLHTVYNWMILLIGYPGTGEKLWVFYIWSGAEWLTGPASGQIAGPITGLSETLVLAGMIALMIFWPVSMKNMQPVKN